MLAASNDVLAILKRRGHGTQAQEYAKDVHDCLRDVQGGIVRVRGILERVNARQEVTRSESQDLHGACRSMLDSIYRFRNRLHSFSVFSLIRIGIRLNPSWDDRFKKILSKKARGTIAHVREPFYIYATSQGDYPCANCDSGPDSYEGECRSIRIQFRENDGAVTFEIELAQLVTDIESCVKRTLTKYYEYLNTRLPPLGDGSRSDAGHRT